MAEQNITIRIIENKTVGQCRALYLQCIEQKYNPLSSGDIVVRYTFNAVYFLEHKRRTQTDFDRFSFPSVNESIVTEPNQTSVLRGQI